MDCFARLAEFSKRMSFPHKQLVHHAQDCLDIDLCNFSWELCYFRHVNADGWDSLLHCSCFTLGSAALLIIPAPFKTRLLCHSQHCSCVSRKACLQKAPDVVQSSSPPLTCPCVLPADAGWLYVLAQRHWVFPNVPGFLNQLFLNCSRSGSLWLTHWSPINWIIEHFPLLYLASAFIK